MQAFAAPLNTPQGVPSCEAYCKHPHLRLLTLSGTSPESLPSLVATVLATAADPAPEG